MEQDHLLCGGDLSPPVEESRGAPAEQGCCAARWTKKGLLCTTRAAREDLMSEGEEESSGLSRKASQR